MGRILGREATRSVLPFRKRSLCRVGRYRRGRGLSHGEVRGHRGRYGGSLDRTNDGQRLEQRLRR